MRKITAYNPKQHPSMLQVATSLSDDVNVVVERKAWCSTMDGENTNAKPRVKKLKYSVPNRYMRPVLAQLDVQRDASAYG